MTIFFAYICRREKLRFSSKRRKIMNYFIPQIDYSDCGFACLKMMIAHQYQNKDALYIKQDESHGPYSLLDLTKEALKYGITLKGIECEDKNNIKEMPLPAIILLQKKNNVCHYVLLTKVRKTSLTYLDPEEGEVRTSKTNFKKIWTGAALIIENFEAIEVSFPHEILINKKVNSYLTTILQFLSAAFMIVGVYFIDDKSKIYIPLLFLSSAFIFELILRYYLIARMEKFDETFIKDANIEKGKYSLFYQRYEEYKKASLVTNMNLAFSFLTILFIAVVILMNNIYNAFIILTPLFLSIVDLKIITPAIKEKEQVIAIEERELSTLRNVDMLKRQMDKIHLRSYKLARKILVKKYVILAILVVTALLTTVFNETFSLPYVIFYFALCYLLFEQYTNFMKYPICKNEQLKSKVRLLNLMSDK